MKITYIFRDNKKLVFDYDVKNDSMKCSNKCYAFKNKCDDDMKKSCHTLLKKIIGVTVDAYNNLDTKDLCEGLSSIKVQEVKK